ncbi:DUF5980 family protein [Kibdelosporangium aridum]|uniref:DUF5980 family protein n=1 Tax=Kibdelosporangium aridum TaxID=2030 RepID=UPI000A93FFE6|nr:DUF5980 family protein [Kibdelosporangium aridum]
MRLTHRAVRLLLCLAAVLTLALTGAVPVSASQSPATATKSSWKLVDLQQRMCLTADFGHPNTYFVALVQGTWSRTITTGIRNLPPGSSTLGGSILPPGSHYGSDINGWIQVTIAPTTPGLYTAEVWAADGVQTQTTPARIYMLEHTLVGCPPT